MSVHIEGEGEREGRGGREGEGGREGSVLASKYCKAVQN